MDKQALPITNPKASQTKSYEYDPQRKDEREYKRRKTKTIGKFETNTKIQNEEVPR